MKVHLKERLSKKTGKISLYLEIYKGYIKEEGKIKHIRDYEYLDYFLYEKPKNQVEKQHNAEHLKFAEAVRAQRFLEIQNGTYGFNNVHLLNANFIEYFKKLAEERKESRGNYGNWDSALKQLVKYAGKIVPFKNVTIEFCEGFKEFLLTNKTKTGKPLAKNSVISYLNKLKAALNQAFDDKIINENPAKRIKNIKVDESSREYLTKEEIEALIETDCRYEVLKRAFLFSCFTGMRWSDVNKLTWKDVQKFENRYRIHFTQKKTRGVEYLDIPDIALKYMGEKGESDEKVFVGLKYSAYMNTALARWVLKAGITKTITFHCARHTFATFLLTKGVEIYTVSKMLGHRELKTTQVYAKIIDQKKREAASIFDEDFKK
ncbi:site-specific integrase [Capnocytophaga gingivalis]|jgi:integrase family protein|uniref:tyrosine-type recombinase/integrase n=1 Tax=Capnocytophaga gingivalis TaxID=1017 RepID=UPI0028D8376A|nr:site-specific integrase [Capnocytophaga gingivalis]